MVLVTANEYRLSLMELVERHAITVFMECCVILLERFSTDDALGIGIYSRIFCVVKPD